MSFSITLVVTNPTFAAAYSARFRHLPRASVVESRWEALPPHDCFVTAGSSYGLMSAGIDAVVVREFGPSVEQAVQLHILNTYLGEQRDSISIAHRQCAGTDVVSCADHAGAARYFWH